MYIVLAVLEILNSGEEGKNERLISMLVNTFEQKPTKGNTKCISGVVL